MIVAIIYVMFLASVVLTGEAIRRGWPPIFAAYGGFFTGVLLMPAVIQTFIFL